MKSFFIALSKAMADMFNIWGSRETRRPPVDDAEAIRSDWEKVIGKF